MNNRLIERIENEQHHFITEKDVDPLIANGFGGLPVVIRRSMGRNVVRVRDLKETLARPMHPHDYVRDVSTWPECIKAIYRGETEPTWPGWPSRGSGTGFADE